MPITGWSQVISPYAAVWGPGASIYAASYATGSSIYSSVWIKYENGQPVFDFPQNIVAPLCTGTPAVGNTVQTDTGSWLGNQPISYTYLWIRDTGGAGTPIVGATNSSYVIQLADVGYSVHCQVTATNSAGSAAAQSNSTATAYEAVPVNTVLPVITGTAVVGQLLSCSQGTWTSATSVTYAYQWKRSGSSIGGATSSTYTLVSADYGNTITCTVTATNGGGSVPATSAATGTVAEPVPVNTVAPVASGHVFEMLTLSVTTGTWTSITTPTYTYQWKRNGSNISSATSSTYTVVQADEDQSITCTVTATNTAGGASATSNTLSDWTPAQDSNVAAWLQANRKANINAGSPANNDLVDTWVSNNINASSTSSWTQSTTASKPTYKTNILNGLPAIQFNGAGSAPGTFLTESSTELLNRSGGRTVILVMQLTSFPVAYQYIMNFKTNGGAPSMAYSTNASYKDFFFGDDVSGSQWKVQRYTTISNINNFHYIIFTYNGGGATTIGNFAAKVDNVSLTQTATTGNDGTTGTNIIGNYKTSTIYGWTGYVVEMITLYTGTPSTNYATYINAKYGL